MQARASALCEGLERYSALFQGDEPRVRGCMTDLGKAAIDPNACMLFSPRQYEARDPVTAQFGRTFVPAPFDADQEMDWTSVWSLTRDDPRLLPTAFCYFNYPAKPSNATCMGCSNGNAAGNTLEEAMLQGLLELVERDAIAMWWYNRLLRPRVNLDSFDLAYVQELREHLSTRHVELWVLDLTSDLGIPVFAALSRWSDGRPDDVQMGFGAHFEARIALLRAVTELNQKLVGTLSMATGATTGGFDLSHHPYLGPAPEPGRVAGDFTGHWSDDLREDVLAFQALVESKGMEMLVLDQTRPDVGLPVVKVIVPGLRHFWPRFGPGRLFDVPVRLGWLPAPLAEEELNPLPVPP
ncbi:MAG: hypothetical protein NVSMB32_01940 [Actinomycetota bacterium]